MRIYVHSRLGKSRASLEPSSRPQAAIGPGRAVTRILRTDFEPMPYHKETGCLEVNACGYIFCAFSAR
jgi:hypothetical protein